jgi:acetyl esterase/lipase
MQHPSGTESVRVQERKQVAEREEEGTSSSSDLQMRVRLALFCLWGIVMKPLLFALCVVFASGGVSAQKLVWQPSPGHTQVPIWPGAVPDAQPVVGPENTATETKELVAGMPWVYVGKVSRPTMTVYAPKEKNTGAAVVVFPGGGYQILAIDLEGTEVCDWLTSKGITCVLLKYRVPGEGGYPKSAPYPKSGPYPESPMALEDAQRTMGLVRFHAAEWHIDPHKIGVLGFSAGGHLSAAISAHFAKRLYPAVDAADNESCRPDFAVSIYPGHLSLSAAEWDAKQGIKKFVVRHPANADKELALNPDVPVTSQTPPTFLLQAEDDHVDNVDDSLAYYIALKKTGVPVEMHLYAYGGHAFGLRRTELPITGWPQFVEKWLGTIGIISK